MAYCEASDASLTPRSGRRAFLRWVGQADRLGSIIALTDGQGNLAESYHYTPYGQPYKASSIGNPFLFTGREYDSESGLYHYRARAYDPNLRRFLQPDPIGFADSMNLYGYVKNGPLNAVDPWGLSMSFDKNNDGIWDEDVENPADLIFQTYGISLEEIKRRSFWMLLNLSSIMMPMGPAPFGAEFCGPKFGARTSGETKATKTGRKFHEAFKEKVKSKPNWRSEPSIIDPATGKIYKPDAISPSGRPVELKPNTPTGKKSGQSQLKKYEEILGKKGRVIYYYPH